uniref:Uncharacterized protein n=1 Tax=Micrurus spixii TaxID=129469 RepID=A0A2D4MVJ7_9SAUR
MQRKFSGGTNLSVHDCSLRLISCKGKYSAFYRILVHCLFRNGKPCKLLVLIFQYEECVPVLLKFTEKSRSAYFKLLIIGVQTIGGLLCLLLRPDLLLTCTDLETLLTCISVKGESSRISKNHA